MPPAHVTLTLWQASVAFAVALAAGVINALAAGGTLATFPTLIWLGLDSVTANATSTVALWPFNIGAALGYRRETLQLEPRMFYLIIPGALGGFVGAMLLRLTPVATFDRLVPYLILFATLLFMLNGPIQKLLNSARSEPTAPDARSQTETNSRPAALSATSKNVHDTAKWFLYALGYQIIVGLYGGYFGAGIGIMMLAAFSILGMADIHQMNALKNILGGAINAIAAIYFIAHRMVYWPYVGIMAAGSIAGGFAGAHMARRIGRAMVRKIVIAVGFLMAISLFLKK
jgi:uncharacterized protein